MFGNSRKKEMKILEDILECVKNHEETNISQLGINSSLAEMIKNLEVKVGVLEFQTKRALSKLHPPVEDIYPAGQRHECSDGIISDSSSETNVYCKDNKLSNVESEEKENQNPKSTVSFERIDGPWTISNTKKKSKKNEKSKKITKSPRKELEKKRIYHIQGILSKSPNISAVRITELMRFEWGKISQPTVNSIIKNNKCFTRNGHSKWINTPEKKSLNRISPQF